MARSLNSMCRGGARATALGVLLIAAGLAAGALRHLRDAELPVEAAGARQKAPAPAERNAPAASTSTDPAPAAVPAPGAAAASAARDPESDRPLPGDAATPAADAAASTLTADSGQAQLALRFTVAVEPPDTEVADGRAALAFDYIYRRFLAELRSIPGLELLMADSTEAGARPALAGTEADFILELKAVAEILPNPVWSFTVNWAATRGESGAWATSDIVAVPQEGDAVARDAAAALRRYPFPPDRTRAAILESIVLDVSRDYEERHDAIEELQRLPRRYALIGRDEQRLVSVAAANIVINSPDPEIRGLVWRAMVDAEDPYLIGPLFDSMQTDPSDYVRLEAIKALAGNFSDDTRTMAALEYAVLNDLSPRVRAFALWEGLDEEGRWGYVAETLLNDELSDSERLELVSADVREFQNYVDRQTVQALIEIAGPVRSSAEAPVSADDADGAGAELAVPALLDILAGHANGEIRATVASALGQHLDDGAVRAAMQQASRDDPSPYVRSVVDFALRTWERDQEDE